MKEDILMIAAVSRKACEEFNNIYGYFPETLNGMCGLASHFLFNNLKKNGYNPHFIMASHQHRGSHCWLSIGNFNIDITGTQFSVCSPIYNYKGKMEDHPLLRNTFKASQGWLAFPFAWEFQKVDSHKDIGTLMKEWSSETSYRGLTRKRLDNLYKVN